VSDKPQDNNVNEKEEITLTKEQVMEILKNIVVSVDINENAVVISAKKLLSYFLKGVQGLDKVIKVDNDSENNIVVYSSIKPKNPNLKSLTLKAVIKASALNLANFKYKMQKTDDDVYIKLYVQQQATSSNTSSTTEDEVDF